MIDIHMHVIPGVDDGSGSLKESLSLLRLASAQGVTAVITTSHGDAFDRGYSEHVRNRFDDLVKAAKDEIPSMRLYFGAEIFCSRRIIGISPISSPLRTPMAKRNAWNRCIQRR